MTKGAKLGFILGVGLVVAGVSYYYLIWKPAHKNPKPTTDGEALQNWLTGGGQGGNTGVVPPQYKPIENAYANTNAQTNGLQMYSKIDNLNVRNVSDGSLVKTLKKNDFIGIYEGETIVGGAVFVKFNGGRYRVPKAAVRMA